MEITSRQTASQENRKVLTAALTRFRQAKGEAQASLVPEIIAKFKGEVDFQTRRARYVERAFVSLYSALFEAPDPAPLLERARELEIAASEARADAERAKADRDAQAKELAALRSEGKQVRLRAA